MKLSAGAKLKIALLAFCIILALAAAIGATFAWFSISNNNIAFSSGQLGLGVDIEDNIFFQNTSSFPTGRQLSYQPSVDPDLGEIYLHSDAIWYDQITPYQTNTVYDIMQDINYIIPVSFMAYDAQSLLYTQIPAVTDDVLFEFATPAEIDANLTAVTAADVKTSESFNLQAASGYIKPVGNIGDITVIKITAHNTDPALLNDNTVQYIIFRISQFTGGDASMDPEKNILRHNKLDIANLSTTPMKLRLAVEWQFLGDVTAVETDLHYIYSIEDLINAVNEGVAPQNQITFSTFQKHSVSIANFSEGISTTSPLALSFANDGITGWYPVPLDFTDASLVLQETINIGGTDYTVNWIVDSLNLTETEFATIVENVKQGKTTFTEMTTGIDVDVNVVNGATAYFYRGTAADNGILTNGDYGTPILQTTTEIRALDSVAISPGYLSFSIRSIISISLRFQARQAKYYFGNGGFTEEDWWHSVVVAGYYTGNEVTP